MKRLLASLSMLLIVFIASGLLLAASGLRINTSNSIPKGFYWITNEQVSAGKYVIFCPEETAIMREAVNRGFINVGFCPGGLGSLMKQVAATDGDVVSSTSYGVIVNSLLRPLSRPQLTDSQKRSLPQWRVINYRLKSNELLVMTDQSSLSFDGRYFGLVHKKQIKGVINPLLTWPLLS